MVACPRCGSAPVLEKIYDNTEITTAKCSNANCKHSSVTGLDETMARKLWNIRAGGRKPAMPETGGTKGVGISDLLADMVERWRNAEKHWRQKASARERSYGGQPIYEDGLAEAFGRCAEILANEMSAND